MYFLKERKRILFSKKKKKTNKQTTCFKERKGFLMEKKKGKTLKKKLGNETNKLEV